MSFNARNAAFPFYSEFNSLCSYVNCWDHETDYIYLNCSGLKGECLFCYYLYFHFNGGYFTGSHLTRMLVVANLNNTKWCKKPENDWNPGIWVIIWEYSVRAIQWITTWQGLDGFQKSLHPWALDESSHSIGRVNGAMTPSRLFTNVTVILRRFSIWCSIHRFTSATVSVIWL